MRLCSFGRSLLDFHGSSSASWRRCLRALLAARRRWPDGRLVISLPGSVSSVLCAEAGVCCGWSFLWRGLSLVWECADGCAGVMVSSRFRDLEGFVPRPVWLGGEREAF